MEAKKTEKANLENKKGIFLLFGLLLVLTMVLAAFEWTSKPELINTLLGEANADIEEEIIPITRQQETPPPPPPPPQVIEVLNIVEDDVELDEEFDMEDTEADSDTEIEIVEFDDDDEEAAEEVFYIVEDMPTFKGGDLNSFRKWVQSNMKYPSMASEHGISGRVFVQFAVNAKGEVVNVVIVRGVDPALDKEAKRAVTASPKWSAGKQRGKPVKVQFTMPVNFVLN